MRDIQANIFDAIDQLIDSKINSISFDKTIVAEIIDDSKANENKYYVQSGSDKFYAWSSGLTYTKGTRVYITVPQGDYSQRKLILGIYTSEKYDEQILTSPLKRMIDISGNLITNTTASFKANENKTIPRIVIQDLGNIVLDNYNIGVDVKYLGLSADITTGGLEEATKGNYGFALIKEGAVLHAFDCSQFLGDPYNYFTTFRQEIVFDVTGLDNLNGVSLIFYNRNNYDFSTSDYSITASNIKLCYGPSATEYTNSEDKKEFVIYPIGSSEYTDESSISIGSRWIREREDEPGTYETIENGVNAGEGVTYDIYRYTVGCENVGAGPHWAKVLNKNEKPWVFDNTIATVIKDKVESGTERRENIPDVRATGGVEKFKAVINRTVEIPEGKRISVKIIENSTSSFSLGNKNIIPESIMIFDGTSKKVNKTITINGKDISIYIDYEKGIIKTNDGKPFVPMDNDETTNEYTLEFYYNYNDIKDLTSNTLEFQATGANAGKPEETSEVILSFPTDDKYQGIYQVYGYDQTLINQSLATQEFQINASPADNLTKFPKGAPVEWRIPAAATMIAPDGWDEFKETGSDVIKYYFKKETLEEETASVSTVYKIKSYYSINSLNNTITCIINDKKATKDLTFRMMGTSGTDYTLAIELYRRKYIGGEGDGWSEGYTEKAWCFEAPQDQLQVVTHLYNSIGEEITFNNDDLTISLNQETTAFEINGNIILPITENITENYKPTFITASLNWVTYNNQNIKLKTTIPLPVWVPGSKMPDIPFQAPARVIYNNEGKEPIFGDKKLQSNYTYSFEQTQNNIVTFSYDLTYILVGLGAITEEIEYNGAEKTTYKAYTPPSSLMLEYIEPTYIKFYNEDENENIKEFLYQPILLEANSYASELLNNWTGDLKIDEDNNYILTNLVGAGTKDSDNKFTGVMMGEVGKTFDNSTFGLYGYKSGTNRFKLDVNGNFYVGNGEGNHIELTENGDFDIAAEKFKLQTGDNKLYISNEAKTVTENEVEKKYLMILGSDENKRLTVDESGVLDVKGIIADSIEIKDDNDKLLFKAANKTVEIAGWQVDKEKIYAERQVSMLPVGYTLLKSITNTADTYIDLGIKPTDNTGFQICFENKIQPSGAGGYYGTILGARDDSTKNELQLTSYNDEAGFNGTLRFGNVGYNGDFGHGTKVTKTLINKNYNNEILLPNTSWSSEMNLCLFALNDKSRKGPWQYGRATIYYLKIYNQQTLIMDLVPCKNTSKEIGFYDLITERWFTANNLSGTEYDTDSEREEATPKRSVKTYINSVLGQIQTNNLLATEGNIGGWRINDKDIYKTNAEGYSMCLSSDMVGSPYRCFGIGKFNPVDLSWGDEVDFSVTGDGKLFARGADIGGKITATEGDIGGWKIGKAPKLGAQALYKTTGTYEIGMGGTNANENLAFYVKKTSDSSNVFYVKNNGQLYAQGATIVGGDVTFNPNDYTFFKVTNSEVKTRGLIVGTLEVTNTGYEGGIELRTGTTLTANGTIVGRLGATNNNTITLDSNRILKLSCADLQLSITEAFKINGDSGCTGKINLGTSFGILTFDHGILTNWTGKWS